MLNPLIKQVPVVGQAYGFTKTAMKVYNSTLKRKSRVNNIKFIYKIFF